MSDNKKFIADVQAFKDKTMEKMLRVAKQSIQDTIQTAQTPEAPGGYCWPAMRTGRTFI